MARSTPAHRRIAEEIRRRIIAEEYEGDSLPPEVRLAEEFGVSRPTVRVALQHLVNDGLLVRQAGSGTRILRDGRNAYWAIGSLSDLTGEFRLDEVVTMSARPIPASERPDMAELLGIGADRDLYHIHRLLSKDGFAYGYSHMYCDPSLEESIPREEIGKSFFIDLVLRYSRQMAVRVQQRTSAILPDAEARATLGIDEYSPVLVLRRTYFAIDDAPLVHIDLTCRGDKFEQVINLVHSGWTPPAR
ncbi:GntR family transcriptional regulator [Salipiger abyssi]|uniref:Transcriptional regulator n=1 Tax=Salipiger abyssi TaxID=1250539 RepID=A0A1P8V0S0_9RHOB|nr:GntR family transcriptional regulator [Salipiger abyssi]APZ55254.1 transcriptional regulator [Salipiger abyssi]